MSGKGKEGKRIGTDKRGGWMVRVKDGWRFIGMEGRELRWDGVGTGEGGRVHGELGRWSCGASEDGRGRER